jgi:hypothetical protein
MAESRARPLLPWSSFKRHLMTYGAYAGGLLAVSLAIGVAGFHWLAGQTGLDSLLNAAMLLGGQGPIGLLHGTAGKLFAAAYALYAGIVFLGATALVLAPVLHRLIHRLHLEEVESGHDSG